MSDTRVKERRKGQRLPLRVPVQVEFYTASEPLGLATANVSEGGVFIPTDSPLAVSTRLTLTFRLPALDSNMQATGTVVRANSQPTEAGEPAGMAVEFLEYGKLGWKLLHRLIEAQMAGQDE